MDLFDDGCSDPPPSRRASTKRQRLDDGGIGVNSINGGIGGLVGVGGGGGPANSSDAIVRFLTRIWWYQQRLGYIDCTQKIK